MSRTFVVLFLAMAIQGAAIYTFAENNFFPRLRKVTQQDARLLPIDFLKNNSRWWFPFDKLKTTETPNKANVIYITVPTENVDTASSRKRGDTSDPYSTYQSYSEHPSYAYSNPSGARRQYQGSKPTEKPRRKYDESEYLQYPQFVSILPPTPIFFAVPGWTGNPPPPFVPPGHNSHNHRKPSKKHKRPEIIEPPMDEEEPFDLSLPGTPTTTDDDGFFNDRPSNLDNRKKPSPTKRPKPRPTKKPTTTTPKPDSVPDEFDNKLLGNKRKKPRPSRKPRPGKKPKPSKKPIQSTPEPDSAEEDIEQLIDQMTRFGNPFFMITPDESDSLENRKKIPRPTKRPTRKPTRKPTKRPTNKPTTEKPALELPPSENSEPVMVDEVIEQSYELTPISVEEPNPSDLSNEDETSSEDETAEPELDNEQDEIEENSAGNIEQEPIPIQSNDGNELGSSTEKPSFMDDYSIESESDSLANRKKKPRPSRRPRPTQKPTTTEKPVSQISDSSRPDPIVMDEIEEDNYGYGAIRIEETPPSDMTNMSEMMEENSEVAIETEDDAGQQPMTADMVPEELDSTESLGPDDTLITVRRHGKPMRLRLDEVKPWELFKLPKDDNWQRSLQKVHGRNYFFIS